MLRETVGSVRFEGKHICVDVDSDAFGSKNLVARFDASKLHPFTPSASDKGLFDLLDFCIAFYALDRSTPRPSDGWSRRFVMRLPVSDPDLWRRHMTLIRDWAYALTNDEMEVIPVPRRADGEHHDRQPHLAVENACDTVGLVSDGLDSLCGVDAAIRERSRRIAWASVVGGSKGPQIDRVVAMSREIAGRRLPHFTINTSLSQRRHKAREKTQRSRTVLAIVMAFTTAHAIGANSVECYENGIGLLNLPVPDLQFGAMSTQVLQPKFLPLWDRISKAFFGHLIELRFPNRFETKSEMIRGLSERGLVLLPKTFSCDASERSKKSNVVHCGTCGSCRFRQLAIFDAGVDCDANYAFVRRKNMKLDAAHLLHYHARLLGEAVASDDPWAELCRLQPELRGIELSDDLRLENRSANAARDHQQSIKLRTIELIKRHTAAVARWTEPHRAA